MTSLRERPFMLDDETRVYPDTGTTPTLGAERDQLDESEARGW